MKRIYCAGALVFSLLLGVMRAADLFWNTDAETGFLRSGSVALRYAFMLFCTLLILLAGHSVPLGQPCGLRAENAPWMRSSNLLFIPLALCCELYGFLFLLNRVFGVPVRTHTSRHAMDHLRLYYLRQFADGVHAALFVVFGIWCLFLFFENLTRILHGQWMLTFGMLGSTAFYLHTVLCFIERPSSLFRTVPVVHILSALSGLLFVTALLRALYLPYSFHTARALCRSGLLSFFFCTCLALPQAVWQFVLGGAALAPLILAVGFGCLGLAGAACARCTARVREWESPP